MAPFVSRGGLEGLQFKVTMAWFSPINLVELNLQITNPEEIKVCIHEANARIEIGMSIGRFQKISIPIPRTAFRISEGEGGFTIMEF